MKKIEKIKVRWHPRKLITYLTFIALAGLFIFWKFYMVWFFSLFPVFLALPEEMRYNKVMVNLPSPTFVGTIDAK